MSADPSCFDSPVPDFLRESVDSALETLPLGGDDPEREFTMPSRYARLGLPKTKDGWRQDVFVRIAKSRHCDDGLCPVLAGQIIDDKFVPRAFLWGGDRVWFSDFLIRSAKTDKLGWPAWFLSESIDVAYLRDGDLVLVKAVPSDPDSGFETCIRSDGSIQK